MIMRWQSIDIEKTKPISLSNLLDENDHPIKMPSYSIYLDNTVEI